MAAGFRAIWWAKSAPAVRRADGRPDSVAHHVLLVLSTFADSAGLVRPRVDTVAAETLLGVRAVRSALERLTTAGLIEQAGDFNGTTVWRLNLSITRPADAPEEQQTRTERARSKSAERSRRYRERIRPAVTGGTVGAERNAAGQRDVTPCDTVTGQGRHGVGQRDVTPRDSVSNAAGQRDVTPPRPSQMQVRPPVTAIGTTNELPIELPSLAAAPREERDADAKQRPSTVDESGFESGFERFWSAYPRRVAKGRARVAWSKALKAGTPVEVILDGAARYAAARDGQDPRYTAHPATWLGGERWTDEPARVPAAATSGGSWTPYRNPDDESVYDEPLM